MEPASFSLMAVLSKWWIGLIGFFWWKTKKAVENYERLERRVIELEAKERLNTTSLLHVKELLEVKLSNIEGDIKEIKQRIK